MAGWLACFLVLLVLAWRDGWKDGWRDGCNVVEQQAGMKAIEFVAATSQHTWFFDSVCSCCPPRHL